VFTVGGLDDQPREGDVLAEALAGYTQSALPDQAAFRIDFPRWRRRFNSQKGRVMDALMAGGKTGHVAECFGLCEARVSQTRREFRDNWDAFHEDHDQGHVVERQRA
jgi:hypothetical protein